MLNFFIQKKYDIYKKIITECGAGDSIEWTKTRTVKGYIEAFDGEKLIGTNTGNKDKISLLIYTKQHISNGERIYLTEADNITQNWYEIRSVEYYNMPFLSYYKGYLVKTDENI